MEKHRSHSDYSLLQDGDDRLTLLRARPWTTVNLIVLALTHLLAILVGVSGYKLYTMQLEPTIPFELPSHAAPKLLCKLAGP